MSEDKKTLKIKEQIAEILVETNGVEGVYTLATTFASKAPRLLKSDNYSAGVGIEWSTPTSAIVTISIQASSSASVTVLYSFLNNSLNEVFSKIPRANLKELLLDIIEIKGEL